MPSKKQVNKVISQCMKILENHFIDSSKFTYDFTEFEFTIDIQVYHNGQRYYEFTDIYTDDRYNITQYNLDFV
jgi:hypothetical protein